MSARRGPRDGAAEIGLAALGLRRHVAVVVQSFPAALAVVGSAEHHAVAAAIADKTVTLIKDAPGVLPLDPAVHRRIRLYGVSGDADFTRTDPTAYLDVVQEELEGVALAYPDRLRVNLDPAYVVRADAPVSGKVGVLSGGGSGHEPMHGGFVGPGMLDAACPGAVFTSPTPDQMLAATQAVNGGAGVLHIVKNYTGDIMNFEAAAELAAAEGIEVESVVIDDDVAVRDSTYTAGRRGVGGTVLAEKICGAAAEAGRPLADVAELCRRVNGQVRSMGMALTSCIVPHVGTPTFELGDDEMEIGIGIHGEPGRERLRLEPADRIVERLLEPILDDGPINSGDRVLAFVNGMGGTPLVELFIVYRHVAQVLDSRGITITRNLIGPYITSLEMAGTSITLLRLDDELTSLWDAPVNTPGLRWGV